MDPVTVIIGCGLLSGSFTLLATTGVLLRANALIERASAEVESRIAEFEGASRDQSGRHLVVNPASEYAPRAAWTDTAPRSKTEKTEVI